MSPTTAANAAVLFDSYPFYVRPLTSASVAALSDLEDAAPRPQLAVPLGLLRAVEQAGAVSKLPDGSFTVDPALLAKAVPDQATQLNVLSAVSRANELSTLVPEGPIASAAATTTAPIDVVTVLKNILGGLPNLAKIQQDLTDIAAGATVTGRHWWGVQINFTKRAADALADLVGTQIASISTVMTALAAIPSLQVLGVIAGIFSALLKFTADAIASANSGAAGVHVTLLLWFIPVVKPA